MKLLALGVLLIVSSVNAQEGPVPVVPSPLVLGEVLTLQSSTLQQERKLNVYLPEGYSDPTLTYPVIYVLDGGTNEDFTHIAGLAQFMNMYDLLPKSVIVGISNSGRSRYHDFTGMTESDSDKVWIPTYGGSVVFMDYLEKEVQPTINAHYRTSGHRTLIGQSLGGLLGTEILFDRPDLFDAYILVSPSIWWNSYGYADRAGSGKMVKSTSPKRVYIAAAKDDGIKIKKFKKFIKGMKAGSGENFSVVYEQFPLETHATILHRAVYRAFEVLHVK